MEGAGTGGPETEPEPLPPLGPPPGAEPLPPGPLPPPHPLPSPSRPFGPLAAFLVFLASFGGQILGGVVVGLVLAFRGGRAGMREILEENMAAIVLLSTSFGSAAALVVARLLAGPLRKTARFGVGPASARQLLAGAGAGLLLGLALHAVLRLVPPPEGIDTPMTRLASTEQGYWALMLVALVLAPPMEEFLFRGVIYDGLRARMPGAVAAVLMTVLFTALHATECIHYPPAFGLIAGLSLLALKLRLATGSLLPAVAVHFVYNACAVLG